MNAPSIKRLCTVLGLSREAAINVREAVKTCNRDTLEHTLAAIMAPFGYFDAEVLVWDGCWPLVSYINSGDTYTPTIIIRWRWHHPDAVTIGCWGDVAEAMERRGHRID